MKHQYKNPKNEFIVLPTTEYENKQKVYNDVQK